jgi:hypothetical protein
MSGAKSSSSSKSSGDRGGGIGQRHTRPSALPAVRSSSRAGRPLVNVEQPSFLKSAAAMALGSYVASRFDKRRETPEQIEQRIVIVHARQSEDERQRAGFSVVDALEIDERERERCAYLIKEVERCCLNTPGECREQISNLIHCVNKE